MCLFPVKDFSLVGRLSQPGGFGDSQRFRDASATDAILTGGFFQLCGEPGCHVDSRNSGSINLLNWQKPVVVSKQQSLDGVLAM